MLPMDPALNPDPAMVTFWLLVKPVSGVTVIVPVLPAAEAVPAHVTPPAPATTMAAATKRSRGRIDRISTVPPLDETVAGVGAIGPRVLLVRFLARSRLASATLRPGARATVRG